MAPNIPIALSFIFVGLLLIGLNVPLMQGKIKRNKFYGIRIRKAFESEENWLKINQYGAKQMILWAAVLVVLGVATLFVPFNNSLILGLLFGLIVVLCSFVPMIQIMLFVKKME